MKVPRKATQGKPLGGRQKRRNTKIPKVRARIQQVFAGLAHMGDQMVRTNGKSRAQLPIATKLAIYNIKLLASLQKCGTAAF